MILGVIAFSFAAGSLSSVMASYDSTEANLSEKILMVTRLRRIYEFSPEL